MKIIIAILLIAAPIFVGIYVFFTKKENMPPHYEDPYAITIDGTSMHARDYVNQFCRGKNDIYRDSPYCQRATNAMIGTNGMDNPNNPFYGVTPQSINSGN